MATVKIAGAIPAYATGADNGEAAPDTNSAYTFEPAEVATTAITFTVLFIALLVMVYAVIRARTFRPLKAKQPALMLLCLLGTLLSLHTRCHSGSGNRVLTLD